MSADVINSISLGAPESTNSLPTSRKRKQNDTQGENIYKKVYTNSKRVNQAKRNRVGSGDDEPVEQQNASDNAPVEQQNASDNAPDEQQQKSSDSPSMQHNQHCPTDSDTTQDTTYSQHGCTNTETALKTHESSSDETAHGCASKEDSATRTHDVSSVEAAADTTNSACTEAANCSEEETIKPATFDCPICKNDFDTINDLWQHQFDMHVFRAYPNVHWRDIG